MSRYSLYLDESQTHTNSRNYAFSISGIIVKDDHLEEINSKLNLLKRNIWNDCENSTEIILHEKDLKEAIEHRKTSEELNEYYKRFRGDSELSSKLYNGLSNIIRTTDITIMGCVVLEDELSNYFNETISNEVSLICMQIIIENFVHFLHTRGATGRIIYEARGSQDDTMLMRYHQISSIGTIYVKPNAIQKYIKYIDFIEKSKNEPALQIADFIPNQVARKFSGKGYNRYAKDLTINILRKAYRGNDNVSRFGMKIIPRI